MHNGGEEQKIIWLCRRDQRDWHCAFQQMSAQSFGDMIPWLTQVYVVLFLNSRAGGASEMMHGMAY